mgnify:CR=1 FL=1
MAVSGPWAVVPAEAAALIPRVLVILPTFPAARQARNPFFFRCPTPVDPPGGPTMTQAEGVLRELLLPSTNPGQRSPCGGQGRVASGRVVRPLPNPGVHAGRSDPPDINVGVRGDAGVSAIARDQYRY